MTNVGDQGSESREVSRSRRHYNPRDVEFVRDQSGMHRSGAAIREKHEIAGIIAASDRDLLDGTDHAGDGDANDSFGGSDRVEAGERGSDASDRPQRQLFAHLDAACELAPWRETPQHKVGVGHGCLSASGPIAGWPGTGSGTARPDIENAPGIHPGNAAAARADTVNVDLRCSDRISLDEMIGADGRIEVVNQAHVGAGSAHVVSDEISQLQELSEMERSSDAARRTRQQRLYRKPCSAPRRHDA